jgi:hypothetical protein
MKTRERRGGDKNGYVIMAPRAPLRQRRPRRPRKAWVKLLQGKFPNNAIELVKLL